MVAHMYTSTEKAIIMETFNKVHRRDERQAVLSLIGFKRSYANAYAFYNRTTKRTSNKCMRAIQYTKRDRENIRVIFEMFDDMESRVQAARMVGLSNRNYHSLQQQYWIMVKKERESTKPTAVQFE